MSMFNDTEWDTNDESCVSNAEKVQIYAMRFSQGHWTFLGPESEEKWYGSSSHAQFGQCTCTAAKMVQRFKETGHPVFKSISALSRGILKRKKGKTSIYFNGDSMNTELLFQTFCKSAQCLRSSGELVLSILFDKKKRDEPVLLWTTRF